MQLAGAVLGADEFSWSVVSAFGPPLTLIGADTLAPSFDVTDDGSYTLRLTALRGESVQVDDLLVTVGNAAPVVASAAVGHVYNAPGAYTVTVADDDGATAVSSTVVDAGCAGVVGSVE